MALSEWPSHFRDDDDDSREIVTVTFETEMFVAVVTDKAIGLKEDDEQRDVDVWLPISQISGPTPQHESWIDSIEIPKWLADDKDLEYE